MQFCGIFTHIGVKPSKRTKKDWISFSSDQHQNNLYNLIQHWVSLFPQIKHKDLKLTWNTVREELEDWQDVGFKWGAKNLTDSEEVKIFSGGSESWELHRVVRSEEVKQIEGKLGISSHLLAF